MKASVVNVINRKTRKGTLMCMAREHYLRSDISCQSLACPNQQHEQQLMKKEGRKGAYSLGCGATNERKTKKRRKETQGDYGMEEDEEEDEEELEDQFAHLRVDAHDESSKMEYSMAATITHSSSSTKGGVLHHLTRGGTGVGGGGSVNDRLTEDVSLLSSGVSHYLLPDFQTTVHYLELLELPNLSDIIFLQTVINELQVTSQRLYSRVRAIIRDPRRRAIVFYNEHFYDTFVQREPGETQETRNKRGLTLAFFLFSPSSNYSPLSLPPFLSFTHPLPVSSPSLSFPPHHFSLPPVSRLSPYFYFLPAIATAADWYQQHLISINSSIRVVLVTEDSPSMKSFLQQISQDSNSKKERATTTQRKVETLGVCCSLSNYLSCFHSSSTDLRDLCESLSVVLHQQKASGGGGETGVVLAADRYFEEHKDMDTLESGVKSKVYFRGTLRVNGNKTNEAYVRVNDNAHLEDAGGKAEEGLDILREGGDIFIPNNTLRNRAVHMDTVAVLLLPRSQWVSPSSKINNNAQSEEKEERENEGEEEEQRPR
jgi:hypothetical protein